MFAGLIIAVLIIIGYAIYAGNRYVNKSELKELEKRIAQLEEAENDSGNKNEQR